MHILILQPELRGRGSHVYMESLGWRRICAARGVGLDMFGARDAHEGVLEELDATAAFGLTTQDLGRFAPPGETHVDDPQTAALDVFMRRSYLVESGCRAAWAAITAPPDLVIFPWAEPMLLNGVAEWLADLAPEARPRLMFNFVRPEASWKTDGERKAASGDFGAFRFAARRLRALVPAERLAMSAVEPRLARLMENMGQIRCPPSPLHQDYAAPEEVEALRPPPSPGVRIGVLGPSRWEKGFNLLAQVARAVSLARPEATFYIQIGKSDDGPALARSIAGDDNAVSAVIQVGGVPRELYLERLLGCDLILLPYIGHAYALMPSGVFGEAAGYGVPVVAPSGTWMSDRLAEGGGAGETFDGRTAADVTAAVVRALDHLPALKAAAAAGAPAWRRTQSLDAYFDHVLRLFDLTAPAAAKKS